MGKEMKPNKVRFEFIKTKAKKYLTLQKSKQVRQKYVCTFHSENYMRFQPEERY